MTRALEQSEIELLSAWIDGELDDAQTQQVRQRLSADEDWAAALREFQAVDEAMGQIQAPPLSGDLTDKILARAHSRRMLSRVLKLVLPAAAAAALILAAFVAYRPAPTNQPGGTVAQTGGNEQEVAAQTVKGLPGQEMLAGLSPTDQLLVRKLDMFQHYDEVRAYQPVSDVVDSQTLAELAKLEGM